MLFQTKKVSSRSSRLECIPQSLPTVARAQLRILGFDTQSKIGSSLQQLALASFNTHVGSLTVPITALIELNLHTNTATYMSKKRLLIGTSIMLAKSGQSSGLKRLYRCMALCPSTEHEQHEALRKPCYTAAPAFLLCDHSAQPLCCVRRSPNVNRIASQLSQWNI
jgi:hypothetical protein